MIASAVAPPPNRMLLEVAGLRCERGDAVLFSELGFSLDRGELLQIEGANGSGKTTLLRILAGLIAPDEGTVTWRGDSPECALVSHQRGLSDDLSGRENLAFARALCTAPSARPVAAALALFAAEDFADRLVKQLSAGQKQRLALARLALFERPLWLLDEPFSALDGNARGALEALVDSHLDGGGAAVIATHHALRSSHPSRQLSLDHRSETP